MAYEKIFADIKDRLKKIEDECVQMRIALVTAGTPGLEIEIASSGLSVSAHYLDGLTLVAGDRVAVLKTKNGSPLVIGKIV